jgi:hypothetical protein
VIERGRDYDDAVAEGLVERIGTEIDKRVDAKFAARDQGRRRSADVTPTDRGRTLWLGIGIGSAATGLAALIVAAIMNGQMNAHIGGPLHRYNPTGEALAGLLGVWGLLVVTYIVYAWVRHTRGQE